MFWGNSSQLLALHYIRKTGFCISFNTLREKCSYSKFFWSVFPRIWTKSLCIQSKYGKIRTRKATNTDTLHAVIVPKGFCWLEGCVTVFGNNCSKTWYRLGEDQHYHLSDMKFQLIPSTCIKNILSSWL